MGFTLAYLLVLLFGTDPLAEKLRPYFELERRKLRHGTRKVLSVLSSGANSLATGGRSWSASAAGLLALASQVFSPSMFVFCNHNFVGFTHICGHARKNGKFLVQRKSIRKRLLAKLKQIKDELRRRMHQPLAEVGKWLKSVVRGYFNYHAVPGNFASLQRFRLEVSKRWLRVIQRRSQKSRMSWTHMAGFVKQWLPLPKILHPYPYLRFDARHPR
jgi:hypothetical protein